jgi:hypothetical protein
VQCCGLKSIKSHPTHLEESREEIVKILQEQQAREALAKDIEALKVRAAKGEHLQTLAGDLAASLKMPVW